MIDDDCSRTATEDWCSAYRCPTKVFRVCQCIIAVCTYSGLYTACPYRIYESKGRRRNNKGMKK